MLFSMYTGIFYKQSMQTPKSIIILLLFYWFVSVRNHSQWKLDFNTNKNKREGEVGKQLMGQSEGRSGGDRQRDSDWKQEGGKTQQAEKRGKHLDTEEEAE